MERIHEADFAIYMQPDPTLFGGLFFVIANLKETKIYQICLCLGFQ